MKLFVALRKGKLTAYGILYDKVKDGFDSSAWNNKEAWSALGDDDDNEGDESDEFDTIKFNSLYSEDMFLNESKVQKIPASHWRFEGVSWKLGKIRSPEGRYVYVHFDFNELIEVFEESEPEYIKIERRDGCLFYGDVANLTILKNQSQILFQFKILKNFVRNSSRF